MSINDINHGNLSSLVYASMENAMTSPEQYKYWQSQTIFGNRGSLTAEQIQNELNAILSNTTIKRACCLASPIEGDPDHYKVNVRVPVPKSWSANGNDQRNIDYGFIDKAVKVPKSFCDAVQSSDGTVKPYIKPNKRDANYSKQCDDFYSAYCPNMMTYFVKETKALNPDAQVDAKEFANFYKQECACLDLFNIFPPNTNLSARCLKFPQCNDSNGDQGVVYLDQESRKQCPDNITICSQIQNLAGASAGKDVNVKTFMENNCGQTGNKTSEVSGTGTSGSGDTTSTTDTTGDTTTTSVTGGQTDTSTGTDGTSTSGTGDISGTDGTMDSVYGIDSTGTTSGSESSTTLGMPTSLSVLLVFILLLLSISSSVGAFVMMQN
jgi:hypothetical protein